MSITLEGPGPSERNTLFTSPRSLRAEKKHRLCFDICGFNIAIIAGLFSVAATRLFGRRHGAWVAIAGIATYTVLVGAGPSVVRAAIMGSLALTAHQIGRRAAGLNTLALAAWGMTLYNPQWLWDVGFQLSAGATLGLVLYAEPLQNAVEALAGRRLVPERAKRAAGLALQPIHSGARAVRGPCARRQLLPGPGRPRVDCLVLRGALRPHLALEPPARP